MLPRVTTSRGVLRFLAEVFRGFRRNQGMLLAGAVAYYTLLAVVPLFALLLVGLSHLVDPQTLLETLRENLALVLPAHADDLSQQVGAVLETDETGSLSTLRLGLAKSAGETQIRDAAQAWLMRQAERVFSESLQRFAPQLGVAYTRLRLSSAGTRWGSANVDGTIRLNWRLIHLKPEMIDYVVVHELSHLRHMDHSPQFWDVVASVMPDHMERRKALRKVPLGE